MQRGQQDQVAHLDASNVLALDDPELMKYPVAFMTEAGYWTMTDKEARGTPRVFHEGRVRHLRRLP